VTVEPLVVRPVEGVPVPVLVLPLPVRPVDGVPVAVLVEGPAPALVAPLLLDGVVGSRLHRAT